MFNPEELSKSIASKLSNNMSIDSDHEEVLAYGAFALIQTLISIIMVVVFGVVFNVLIESIIISFSAAILRKFSGGAHASSPMSCALIGMVIFGGMSLVVKYFIIKIDFLYLVISMIVSYIFIFYIMFKLSPVGSENKPLKNENTRKRLKIKSIRFVSLLLFLDALLMILHIKIHNDSFLILALCITTGAVLQTLTLVSLGHKTIDLLDKIFRGTDKLIRRTN